MLELAAITRDYVCEQPCHEKANDQARPVLSRKVFENWGFLLGAILMDHFNHPSIHSHAQKWYDDPDQAFVQIIDLDR